MSRKQLIFGSLPPEQFDAEYLRLIQQDIAEAQKHLAELPVEDRRGLTLDTLRQFRCGYLPDWVLTKSRAEYACGVYINELTREQKHLPPPSPRIIVPTPSMNHFNAVATPTARRSMDKHYWKQHAGTKELFCTPDALLAKTIIVVEGEFCAMSIWQATGGKVPVVAILGCSNAAKTLFPILSSLPERRFILLLDGDAAGQKAAEKLAAKLDGRGVPNVTKFLYEYMSKAIRNEFGPGHARTDANDLLKSSYGAKYLADIIAKILKESEPQLQAAADRIAERNRQLREDNARADAQKLNLNVRPFETPVKPAATATKAASGNKSDFNAANFSGDPDEDRRILADCLVVIPPDKTSRDEWFTVGCVMKRYGFSVNDFINWSRHDPRFNESDCHTQWNSMKDNSELGDGGYKLGTVIKMAQSFGYYLPPRRNNGINLAAAGYDDVQAAESQNEADEADNSRHSALFEWQKINGTIDPVVMPDLLAAKEYLESVSENISADIAQSSKTAHALAMCKFYDAFVAAHDKFFAALSKAKSDAKIKIKLAESNYDGLTAPENIDAMRILDNVSVRDLKAAVADFTKKIKADHKKFQRAENARLAEEHNKKIRAGIEAKVADSIARLDFLRTQPQSPVRDAEMIKLIRDACEWRYNNRQEPVAVKDTAANADLIFTYDPVIDGLFGYDEFYGMDVFLKAPPWQSAACIHSEFKDRDDQHLRQYIRRTYTELANKDLLYDTVTVFSDKRKFNPIKERFKKLPKWDGVRRAYSLFIDFLRADNNDYVRAVTKNMLLAAIARIMFPGCEFQTAVVLQGEQGIGKSHIFKRLGGKWCAALTDNVDSPNAIDAIQLIWIVEIKEMAAMRKAELNATKSFIERSVDVRRAAYGRRAGRMPRHCIFVITVNDEKFLTDLTGNRRYNIIKCHSKPRDYITGLTDEYIDQVWAEAYHDFCELFKDQFDPETMTFTAPIDESRLELPVAARIAADEVAQNYVRDDGLPTEIQSWLDTKIPPQFIWRLLTKSERAEFCRDKCITIADASEILPLRRSLNFSPRNLERDLEQINNFLNNRSYCRITTIKNKLGDIRDAIEIYGTEYRQHICISEIFNECFGSNSKRNHSRINDMFSRIQGWSLGKGVSSDPEYGRLRQGQVMWRNADNIPNFDDDDAPDFTDDDNPPEENSPTPSHQNIIAGVPSVGKGNAADLQYQNVFGGVPVAKEDLPFDPDDLPL